MNQLPMESPRSGARSRQRLRILVSGWSASGKSVYAKLIANSLDCRYVNASTLVLTQANISQPVNWISDRARIEAARHSQTEKEADRLLLQELNSTSRIVLDSWAVPFLADAYDVALWIECALSVRTRNAIGHPAILNAAAAEFERVQNGLVEKDQDSIGRFRKLYGFEFGYNPHIFNAFVDISDLITMTPSQWPNERATVLAEMLSAIELAITNSTRR